MTYTELEPLLMRGKVGLLTHYKGFFKWDYAKKCMYFTDGSDYRKYELDNEKKRNDWYYII